ncbi:MAG: DNA polymerase III subunit delta [Acidobacteria bacterium]|nr:DNA polymerase III subunit delta [Acidobacteriota bacterium]
MSRYPKKKIDGISYEELRRQVKTGQIESLYLFAGEEEYLQERSVRLLVSTIDEGGRLFNYSTFTIGEITQGVKTTAVLAIDNANQLPMMAARRLVVIRDFDKIREEELDLVLDYLKRPAPTTTLVFRALSLDQRRKITAALMKTCTVVNFEKLSEAQASRYIEAFLKSRNCRIEPAALQHLLALLGTSMGRLMNELEKLVNYAEGGFITNAAIEQLVPRVREPTGFEIWDAIIKHERKRALRLLHRMLDDKAEPVMLVGSLGGLYRRLLTAKDLIARRAPQEEVAKATGQYGQRLKDYIAAINRLSREEIVYGLERLAEVDVAIKSSAATPRLQLEYLIVELTMPENVRRTL